MLERSIWIGYEPREADGYAVCRHSIRKHLTLPIPVQGLVLRDLEARGLYRRPWSIEHGQMFDQISEAPMSTEFACSRFLTPILAVTGLAAFLDCDMLVRSNMCRMFELIDKRHAVSCVKHVHVPSETEKMDGQIQTRYARKNWSSVMVFNCDHEKMKPPHFTFEMVNELPGRDLHRFCWLDDDDIGELPPQWNYLNGHTQLPAGVDPEIVHFTDGLPSMQGYRDVPYADEWFDELANWAG